jgi:alpha-ketoglutarate-dependent taurine dioxygenase
VTLTDSRPLSTVEVHPVAGHTGAEITGIDLATPISEADVAAIKAALHRWKVVFFRDQFIDHAQQIAFGRAFGELTYAHPHDDAPPQGYPEIYTVDDKRFAERYGAPIDRSQKGSYHAGWHTDVTPAVNPPAGSILRADVVPSVGGDTTFTNLVAAYEGLAEPIKRLVDGLRAEHYYGAGNQFGGFQKNAQYRDRIDKVALVAHHPVVRVHPETGERALFVNPGFVGRILDVSPHESRWILDHLFQELTRPEYTVRFRWTPGSIAFWDNRATAHIAPADVPGVDRVLHRVTLIGEVPVGPDGRESALISGEPFRATSLLAGAE